MGWFSDTFITHNEVSTTEIRIVAGAAVLVVAVLLARLCLRTHGKFTKASVQQQVQREIRLNNMREDRMV